jgi:hypothetical protein
MLVVTLATRFKFGRQKRNLVGQANILVDKIEPRMGVLCWNKYTYSLWFTLGREKV